MNPLQFEITYECITDLQEDLEWKVVYVGSAESEAHDQVLDSILLGPVRVGVSNFVLQVDPPDSSRIPKQDLLGVTAILLMGLYKSRDFIRVGYFVNNEYAEEELRLNPPEGEVDLTKVVRNILAEKPRVTRFPIPWDQETIIPPANTENSSSLPAITTETSLDAASNHSMTEEMMPMEVMSTST
eukprot:Phypoly_transcript_17984.p1 GENE.Phypoly_transcript_17984~~Phypoly_transcript_17984.p1  ORF type:complete len:208 (+),score=32.54 Phypoly_transcript_17984:72-626(+)